jgi:hypothetical protein
MKSFQTIRWVLFATLVLLRSWARADQLLGATVCCGAARLDNGSLITIGQGIAGSAAASDNSAALNAGFVPLLASLSANDGPLTIFPSFQPASGRLQLTFLGQWGVTYRVQVSSNLVDWTPLWAGAMFGLSNTFEDPSSAVLPSRFYRVLAQ